MTRKKMQKRFHDLAVKEALSTATPAEAAKLERYQRLLRPKPTREEVRFRALDEYGFMLMRKWFGRVEIAAK